MVNGHRSSGGASGERLPQLEAAFWDGFHLSRYRRARKEERRALRVAAHVRRLKLDPEVARATVSVFPQVAEEGHP